MVDDIKIEPSISPETTETDLEAAVKSRLKIEEPYYPDVALNNGRVSSMFVKMCLDANEVGDGLLYVVINKDKYLYNVTSDEWLTWTGHYWGEDLHNQHEAAVENVVDRLLEETTQISEQVDWAIKKKDNEARAKLEDKREGIYKRITKLRSVRGRSSCIKCSVSCKQPLTISDDSLDINPWLFGCVNGVIDLRSGKFRPGRRDDYITKVSPVAWTDYNEPAPQWEKFLFEVFDNDAELVDYMQRLMGYAISGLTREHIMPVFWGKGRNGKGTLVKMIEYVLGPLAGTIQTELLLYSKMQRNSAGPSPDIVDLKGLRIGIASETEEGQRFSASRVKWLTGGDQLIGRNLNEKKQMRFEPTHTIFLITNNKPSVAGDDYALWQRMHLIPFKLSFVSKDPAQMEDFERVKDPDLDEKLKKEASGILAWLVRGFARYMKEGLEPPQIVKDATLEYMQEEDLLGNFIDYYCEKVHGARTKSGDIYDVFKKWIKINMGPKASISHKVFGRMMKRKFTSKKVNGVVHYLDVQLDRSKTAELGDD